MHVGTIVALLLTLVLIWLVPFLQIWVVFGAANQLMASLALLLVTLWLMSKGKNYHVDLLALRVHVRHHHRRAAVQGLRGVLHQPAEAPTRWPTRSPVGESQRQVLIGASAWSWWSLR